MSNYLNSSLNVTSNITVNTTYFLRTHGLQSFVNILLGLDIASRCFSLGAHLVYFAMVIFIKELRAVSLVYMHQVNFYGLLFELHFCAYIGSQNPSFQDPILNDVLCTISEISWSGLKYLRSYSVLLLAIFRMLAVVNSNLFRKWIKSTKWIAGCMVFQIFCCVLLTVFSKYVIKTTFGSVLCDDGFTNVFSDGIAYFILTSIFGMLIPCMLVTVLYIYTDYSIKKMASQQFNSNIKSYSGAATALANVSANISLNASQSNHNTALTSNQLATKSKFPGKTHLVRQFLLINICLVISLFTFTLLNLANLIEEFSTTWYHFRLLIRISSILSQGIVPIVSLYGNPILKDLFSFKSFGVKVSDK